jgi:hypothetical protein
MKMILVSVSLAALMPGGSQNQEYLRTFEIVWKKTNDAYAMESCRA